MQRPVSPTVRTVSWVLYLVGSALVFGSYLGWVPTGLAWLGWLVGMSGWALITFVKRPPPQD